MDAKELHFRCAVYFFAVIAMVAISKSMVSFHRSIETWKKLSTDLFHFGSDFLYRLGCVFIMIMDDISWEGLISFSVFSFLVFYITSWAIEIFVNYFKKNY